MILAKDTRDFFLICCKVASLNSAVAKSPPWELRKPAFDNEVNKAVKDYSKNKSDLQTYYNVGKLIVEAQGGEKKAKYVNKLIKEYAINLLNEKIKGYSWRNLYNMRSFYLRFKDDKILQPLAAKLTWTNITILLRLKDDNKLNYYINECIRLNLGKRQLIEKIKNNEYERLPKETKNKLSNKEDVTLPDMIKNPIIIKNKYDTNEISEKMLKDLIIEDIENFLLELGDGFSFIGSEYKIKIGHNPNYIDLLLFNIKYNCYVVVELKVTDMKKEYIGQIEVYINYIDNHIKTIYQDKTIGIIIVKKENRFVIDYASDKRILERKYVLT